MSISRAKLEPSTEKLFSRSSGSGGQNVNKVNTKVQLHFQIASSQLSENQKSRLFRAFPDGIIRVESQETRSQARNLELAFKHLQEKVQQSLQRKKKRKHITPPHKTAHAKRERARKQRLQKYKRRYVDAA